MSNKEDKSLNYEREQGNKQANITWKGIFYQYFKEIIVFLIVIILSIIILYTYETIDKTILGSMSTGIVGSIGYLLGKKMQS